MANKNRYIINAFKVHTLASSPAGKAFSQGSGRLKLYRLQNKKAMTISTFNALSHGWYRGDVLTNTEQDKCLLIDPAFKASCSAGADVPSQTPPRNSLLYDQFRARKSRNCRRLSRKLSVTLQKHCIPPLLMFGIALSFTDRSFAGNDPSKYKIQGTANSSWYNADGSTVEQQSFEFAVSVDGCQWKIRLSSTDSVEDYREISCDGKEIFYLTMIESAVKRERDAGRDMAPNIANGFVQAGLVPNIPAFHPVGPLWLAYASHCYFANVTTNRIVPFSGKGTVAGRDFFPTPQQILRTTDWTLAADEPNLPRALIIWEAAGDRDSEGNVTEHPSPFSSGFTNTIFTVGVTTNAHGLDFPLYAQVRTFWIKSFAASAEDLWVRHLCEIRTDRVTTDVESLSFPPTVPGFTTVSDSRFIHDTADPRHVFIYDATNRFSTRQEVQNSPAFLQSRPVATQDPYGTFRGMLVFFVVALTTLLFFGIRAFTASRQTANK